MFIFLLRFYLPPCSHCLLSTHTGQAYLPILMIPSAVPLGYLPLLEPELNHVQFQAQLKYYFHFKVCQHRPLVLLLNLQSVTPLSQLDKYN